MIRISPFTEVEKKRIESQDNPIGVFLEVWQVILGREGHTIDSYPVVIDPTGYAITKEDTSWCTQVLIDKETGNDLAKANWMMDWLNKGPSSYEMIERTPVEFVGTPNLDDGKVETIHRRYLTALNEENISTGSASALHEGMRVAYEDVLWLLYKLQDVAAKGGFSEWPDNDTTKEEK